MRSPFPGVDPYIEGCGLWGDFHPDLITEIKRRLAPRLPPHYLVRQGERPYVSLVEEEGKEKRSFVPDVSVTSRQPEPPRRPPGAAVAEPAVEAEDAVMMEAFIAEHFRETFLEILEPRADEPLVTCIEVLSPSNKRRGSEGWELYLRNRHALLLGQANLVEIDLLRGGTKFPMHSLWPDSPYTLLVCRQTSAPTCKVTKAHFRKRLPALTIPLRSPDPDVTIDLQPMLELIYEVSRYEVTIDYAKPLDPSLPPEDAAWLAEARKAHEATQPAASPPRG
jgi:hypothetical protein